MKVSDYIVGFLKQKGITEFFGYQGTMIAHLVDSIEKAPGVRNHSSYHEQGAAFAACGYAQASGHTAACYATSGPGAINLLSGVADAYYDSLPVVFFTGQLNTYEYSGIKGLRQQGFQETDVVSMARPITKYVHQVWESSEIPQVLQDAWDAANEGRRGPVLIDLPMNIQRGEVDTTPEEWIRSHEEKAVQKDLDAAREAAGEIVQALSEAKRPLFLLGNGVTREAAMALTKLAREKSLPIVTSVLARDFLSLGDDLYFGCLGGAYGHRSANMIASAKCDLIISLGMSLCTRETGTKVAEFAKGAKILRVDIDPFTLQRRLKPEPDQEVGFLADAPSVIGCLKEQAQAIGDYSGWLSVCRKIRQELTRVDDSTPERGPNRLVAALGGCLSDASAVAVDIGQHMVWTYQSFPNPEGMRLLFSGGHGAMGYGLPAAIGAYFATGKPVACICGDGGFQMNIQELQWVIRERIPVRMVVMNNHALGMIRHLQRDYFDCLYAGTTEEGGFSTPDFEQVAKAYGIPALTMTLEEFEKEKSLPGRVVEAFGAKGPVLLQVQMEPGTFAYPKTCLGEGIHNQQPYAPKEVFEELMEL